MNDLRSENALAKGHQRGTRIVTGEAELAAIWRLRYRRYVLEGGKRYPGTDDATGTLIDEEDGVSLQFADFGRDGIAAALRLTFLRDVPWTSYLTLLAEAVGRDHPDDTLLCSRLVTTETRSSLRSIIGLFRAAYATGLEKGSRYSALSTRPGLEGHFARFGYRETGAEFVHPVSGQQVVMLLDLHDIAHLAQIGSPLEPVFRETFPAGEIAR